MLELRKAVPEDKTVFDRYRSASSRYSENSFATLYMWDKYYNLYIAEDAGCLILRFTIDGKNQYMFPMGEGDVKRAVSLIEAEEEGDVDFRFVTEEQKDFLEKNYCGRAEFKLRDDLCDYVYETERLMSLSGKKLHSKKNHVNYFEKTFNYEYEAVSPETAAAECKPLLLKWIDEKTKNLNPVESDAMVKMFDNYTLFNIRGAVLRVDGDIVAMTFGERLTEDTALIQVEKAREDIRGSYPMINKLFLQNEWSDTTFVNREEDMGLEGLRRAKESYCPIFKTIKYQARLRKETKK